MIELIDQSGLNQEDRTVPVVFTYRCTLCGHVMKATTPANAGRHACAPGAREAYAAKQAVPVVTPKPKRSRLKATESVPAPVAEVPKKRGRPRKVAATET